MKDNVLEVKNLAVIKGKKEILTVPDLAVGKGEFVAIAGPNGAGKSTLLRALAFLETPAAGEIYFNGEIIRGREKVLMIRRRMAVVFQDPLLLRGTVLDNVSVGLKLRGIPGQTRSEKARAWLERLNIAHLAGRDVRTLSGGEARRVSLARAMVLEPDVLCLDEPFTYLDTPSKSALVGELKQILSDTQTTALMVTHDLIDVPCLADRLMVMMEGHVRQDGPVEEVLSCPASRQVAEFLGTGNLWDGSLRLGSDGMFIFEAQGGVTPLTVACRETSYARITPDRPVTACIRPEHVLVYPEGDKRHEKKAGSNVFRGKVDAVYPWGYYYRLKIRAGLELTALAGAAQCPSPPKPGDSVTVGLPPERIHIIP